MSDNNNNAYNLRYLAVGALGVAIVVYFFIKLFFPNQNGVYNTYNLILNNATNIHENTPILLSGYKVGYVEDVHLNSKGTPVVKIMVDKNIKINSDSSISVKENGILGGKILEISLGFEDTILKNNQYIYNTNSGISIIQMINMFISYMGKYFKK